MFHCSPIPIIYRRGQYCVQYATVNFRTVAAANPCYSPGGGKTTKTATPPVVFSFVKKTDPNLTPNSGRVHRAYWSGAFR